jgi:hypothetical protein
MPMKSSLVRTTLAALAVLAAAGSASAQEAADSAGRARRSTVHLLPSIGRLDGRVLGFVEGDYERPALIGDAPRVLGLAAEVRTPLRGVDLRVGVTHSRHGFVPDVSQPPRDAAVVGRPTAAITTAGADVVVRGPRLLDVRPYVLAGAGIRHYAFSGLPAEQTDGTPFGSDALVPVLHVGAGLAWDVGRYELYLESSRYFDTLENGERFRGLDNNRERVLSVGVRIPLN